MKYKPLTSMLAGGILMATVSNESISAEINNQALRTTDQYGIANQVSENDYLLTPGQPYQHGLISFKYPFDPQSDFHFKGRISIDDLNHRWIGDGISFFFSGEHPSDYYTQSRGEGGRLGIPKQSGVGFKLDTFYNWVDGDSYEKDPDIFQHSSFGGFYQVDSTGYITNVHSTDQAFTWPHEDEQTVEINYQAEQKRFIIHVGQASWSLDVPNFPENRAYFSITGGTGVKYSTQRVSVDELDYQTISSQVTVHFVDDAGLKIKSDETYRGYPGDEFSMPTRQVDGYDEMSGQPSGLQFTDSDQELTLHYSKQVSEVVQKPRTPIVLAPKQDEQPKKVEQAPEKIDTPEQKQQIVLWQPYRTSSLQAVTDNTANHQLMVQDKGSDVTNNQSPISAVYPPNISANNGEFARTLYLLASNILIAR
ncbi:MucBP domain-containing protein [Weissella diestrammenae]|uniref:MucBP domain-containing protein n=1 Tax=Weissella diestrammenae TaxID=1162633 RepID=A0A7G9T5A9_9LACO|nr:MucBP domain-containing protein [Weissella diestrammenae]MCM0583142.1 MucBP domain-containing protein [Weissella diestrammenae]QNN75284.1 MucBP domain-containing protein [Weissella diestrammenae]